MQAAVLGRGAPPSFRRNRSRNFLGTSSPRHTREVTVIGSGWDAGSRKGRRPISEAIMTRNASHLRLALGTMTLLTLRQLQAQSGDGPGSVAPPGEPPGSDVFVTAREAVLRERPSRDSRFAGTLPGGSRLRLLESGDQYLKVEVVAGTPPAESSSKSPRKPAASTGFLSRDVVSGVSSRRLVDERPPRGGTGARSERGAPPPRRRVPPARQRAVARTRRGYRRAGGPAG